MNVYDCANDLAKALKESHEFKKLQEARLVLKKDAQAEDLPNTRNRKLTRKKKKNCKNFLLCSA